jgi:hypothetical protein
MGQPQSPNAIIPQAWAVKAVTRTLPGDPAMEAETAFWIDELSAWIASDEQEAAIIRENAGADARIILAKDVP